MRGTGIEKEVEIYSSRTHARAHSAVDLIFNSVLPEDGPVEPKHVATFLIYMYIF
jgi:hypothetical protein